MNSLQTDDDRRYGWIKYTNPGVLLEIASQKTGNNTQTVTTFG